MNKILVVDDDPQLREVIVETLSAAGFSSESAADGVEALARLEKEEFDLMLLDVHMPRMDGLEVLGRLRTLPRHPKVVVMTGDDTPETLLRAIRERAYEYISKPFEPAALAETVTRALGRTSEALRIEVVSARPDWVELLVPCDLALAERIEAYLKRLDADLPDEVRERVGLAFRELLMNAIEWGGKLDPYRKVRIAYVRGRRMLLYRIADPGPGFRLEDLEHSAVGQPPEKPAEHMRVREEKGLRPGGFGLKVVRAMVDELIYNEARNEVLFVKYLNPDERSG